MEMSLRHIRIYMKHPPPLAPPSPLGIFPNIFSSSPVYPQENILVLLEQMAE